MSILKILIITLRMLLALSLVFLSKAAANTKNIKGVHIPVFMSVSM
jgi:hypothetical protein